MVGRSKPTNTWPLVPNLAERGGGCSNVYIATLNGKMAKRPPEKSETTSAFCRPSLVFYWCSPPGVEPGVISATSRKPDAPSPEVMSRRSSSLGVVSVDCSDACTPPITCLPSFYFLAIVMVRAMARTICSQPSCRKVMVSFLSRCRFDCVLVINSKPRALYVDITSH